MFRQSIEKANNQTKILDNSSNDINEILNSLKPTKLNKNNMVISSEDVQKIKFSSGIVTLLAILFAISLSLSSKIPFLYRSSLTIL